MVDFSSNIIKIIKDRSLYTKDFEKFKRKENVILFVYDDYKQDYSNHKYIKRHGQFLGRARTHTAFYDLELTKDDEPILFDSIGVTSGYVYGEAYAVPPEFILVLDQIKQNNTLFLRSQRSILLMDQIAPTVHGARPFVQSMIYVGISEAWDKNNLRKAASYFTTSKDKRVKFYEYYEKSLDIFKHHDNRSPYNDSYWGMY